MPEYPPDTRTAPVAEGISGHLREFGRDEGGSLIIFSLYMFILMLMMAGIGIDLMRFERDRSLLQSTLDRAVLAAADLNQKRPPREVVIDYFDTSGLLQYLDEDSIKVTQGINFRNVHAEARAEMPTDFMHLNGVDSLTVPAVAAALERVPNVEISLVLDISGSMRNDGRMTALRPAAVKFVNAVLKDDAKAKTSINLIPYAGQTNPGPWMFDHLNGRRYADIELDEDDGGDENDRYPNVSSCLELNGSDFTHSDLPKEAGYDQTPHFMNWKIASSVMDWGWCPRDESSIIYASNDAVKLNGLINAMRMHDGTGTQYAMKWALALLNPSSQATFAKMATDKVIPAGFGTRPASWKDPETVKYIVLMTDGQVTEQVRPKDPMHPENPTQELNEGRKSDRNEITSKSTNFTRFKKQCDLAKSAHRNVIVYTIAFDAPDTVQSQMKQCASSPSHFFKAGTDDIAKVFINIARQINELKLVN